MGDDTGFLRMLSLIRRFAGRAMGARWWTLRLPQLGPRTVITFFFKVAAKTRLVARFRSSPDLAAGSERTSESKDTSKPLSAPVRPRARRRSAAARGDRAAAEDRAA